MTERWGYRPVLGEVPLEGQEGGLGLQHALGALQAAVQFQIMVSVYSSWISLCRSSWISLCHLHGNV